MQGVVVKSTGSWYQVLSDTDHRLYEARIRGKFKLNKIRTTNPLAVGDFVQFSLEKDDIAWITEIRDRQNYLIRKSVNLSKEAHIIASNVDLACVLFTLKMPETSLGFLDRFLSSCEAYRIPVMIFFNKTDLFEKEDWDRLEFLRSSYQKIGYDSLAISGLNGDHLQEVRDTLKDKTTVLFGHSGSGKSTLINSLDPELRLKTAAISEAHLKGRHTTTFAQMFFWKFGGSVIDTPGVKEFGLIDMEKEEIQHFFPEIFEYSQNCKFYNCLHTHEPHCAVREAIDKGEILESRYDTYVKLMDEAEELRK